MALTTCRDCAREISTDAAACPGCGAPVAPPAPSGGSSSSALGLGCLAVVGVVVLLAIVGNLSDSPAPSSSTTPAASSLESSRYPFEPAQQDGVALRLQTRRLINNAGERCDAVANVRAGGRIDNGDAFVLADCAGGDTHTLLLTPDDRIRYYMSCESAFNPAC